MPMALRWRRSATIGAVNAPANGSRIVSPGREPALIQRSASSGGNVAKCAPLYGLVAIVQTDRLLRVGHVAEPG